MELGHQRPRRFGVRVRAHRIGDDLVQQTSGFHLFEDAV
jgi:hypothetical protein